jgi:hypothetical protein
MNRIRRIIITTTRRRTLRVQLTLISAHCPICDCEVDTLARSQAADVLEVDATALDEMIACGRLHAIQTVSSNQRICKDSLFAPLM